MGVWKMRLTKKCMRCNGRGIVGSYSHNKKKMVEVDCPVCNGKGYIELSQHEYQKILNRLVRRLFLIEERLDKLEAAI